MLSQQETFNYIVNHLRKQGRKSMRYINCCSECVYRGPDGTKCAVGFLIPDDIYLSCIEGYSVDYLYQFGINLPYIDLLKDMQAVHDCLPVDDWERGFEETAQSYGLVYPKPETAIIKSENTLPPVNYDCSEPAPVATAS